MFILHVSVESAESKHTTNNCNTVKPQSLNLNPTNTRLSDNQVMTPLENKSHRSGRFNSVGAVGETKVFVVWVEAYEDCENFPTSNNFQISYKGICS